MTKRDLTEAIFVLIALDIVLLIFFFNNYITLDLNKVYLKKKYKIKSRLIISSYRKDISLLDIKKRITNDTKTKLTAACPIQ